MAQPVPAGSEFLVNTTTAGNQLWPAVAALEGGGHVVVWWDQSATGGDTFGDAIRGQRYDAAGNAVGGELLVNTTTAGSQVRPSVTALQDGGFIVAWEDPSASADDLSGTAIRARHFDAAGNALGSDFVVNSTTADDQTFVQTAALDGGGFVAVWRDDSTGTANADIRVRVFDAAGDPVGNDVVANSTATGVQTFPSAAGLAGGGFVLSWSNTDAGGDGAGWSIQAQRYDAAGNPAGGEFLVNTTTTANQGLSRVAALDDGGFVIVWQDLSGSSDDPSGFAIRGQRYDAAGNAAGGEFLVNTTTASDQEAADVAALPDGGFVVTWWDQSAATDAVRGQRYDAAGDPDGDEFLVVTAAGAATEPDRVGIAVTPDGRMLVSWIEPAPSGDGSDRSVWARFYTTAESSTPGGGGRSNTVTGSGGDDYIIGSNEADVVFGGAGNDVLLGLDGADRLFGGDGADQLFGDLGGDTLYGGTDPDALHGGGSGDLLYGNQGGDLAYGNVGNDTLYGGQDADTIFGGQDDDLAYGNLGDDRLIGNRGADVLYGGQGADTLSGGAGDDLLFGNLGADRYAFGSGDGADSLGGFSGAEGDVITVVVNVNGSAIANASDLLTRLAADANGNAVLDLGGGNTVTLLGVPPSSATVDWFQVV